MKKPDTLARKIIGLAMKVHGELGPGYGETVYRNALVLELADSNVMHDVHVSLSVKYKDVEVGLFQADLIVEKKLLVELKAVDALVTAHSAQLVSYLAATGMDEGLLLNFGAQSLEFKSKWRTYRANPEPPNLHS